ncbi:MAG: hypothetical protein JWN76_2952 [Chitinophagaceae bacterium]|nr:hypothetical protein [Chitinophagaceae bacterium]
MLTREPGDSYIFITQPDHAKLCGLIAEAWDTSLLPSEERLTDAIYAIHHHDDAWHVPDAAPLWDDNAMQPASFITYPLSLKLHFYKYGLKIIADKNPYAGLLCSFHYASFFTKASDTEGKKFFQDEINRQELLLKQLGLIADDPLLNFHRNWLKLCDDISLFICLQEPGGEETSFTSAFKNGFASSQNLLPGNGLLKIYWEDRSEIKFSYPIFKNHSEIEIPFKKINKNSCKEGLIAAWNNALTEKLIIRLKC